jgi:hypothetical protein
MLSRADLVPSKWYVTAICVCGELLILFTDLTKGKVTLAGSFSTTCPTCEQHGVYGAQHYFHKPSIKHPSACAS